MRDELTDDRLDSKQLTTHVVATPFEGDKKFFRHSDKSKSIAKLHRYLETGDFRSSTCGYNH